MSAAAARMGSCGVRFAAAGMGCCVTCAGARFCGVVSRWMRCSRVRSAAWSRGMSASGRMGSAATISRARSYSSVVTSAAISAEAMPTPAVVIAPAGPWTHPQEDAVIEIPRAVEAHRRAGIRRIVVVTIGANRLNTQVDYNLGMGCGCESSSCQQSRHKQCSCADKRFECTHRMTPFKVSAVSEVCWEAQSPSKKPG